ncbi:cytochrome P450 [Pseudomonas sp.]|uniref:cytochrome P450 n=1 Tax=Pseudomonas sp. TaxID=306 RepID=UPI0025FB93B4|nr:cytochrome P450 [Pseudomonas sp.]
MKTISFVDPDVSRCPFAAYDEVRQQGNVYFDESCDCYIVTDYEDVRTWAGNTADLSNVTGLLLSFDSMPWQARIDEIYRTRGFKPVNALTVADPPLHTFHRSLVDKAFTASRVKQMEAYLQGTVDTMIDRFIERGHCDFYAEFASLVPIHVIAQQVGVQLEDIGWFKDCSNAVIAESNPLNTEEEQVAITLKITELQTFIATKIEEFEQTPTDCLLSDLVHADDAGRRMDRNELVSLILILLVAGNDSTALALASAMHRLIRDGLEDDLRADPALISPFIEEVLRLEAPVQGLYRKARNPITIGGTDIPEGGIVVLRFGAANRDPAHFADPAEMRPGRAHGRTHLAFGAGPHFCIGNQLARGELRIALASLLKRMSGFRLINGDGSVSWLSHFLVYGPHRLEIEFDRTEN